MNLHIHNVRQGFATNSSSTHSVVYNIKTNVCDNFDSDDCFGWGNFTLKSNENKSLYLASLLSDNIDCKIPEEITKLIVEKWTGCSGYETIDHQSVLNLPYDYGTDFISKQFFTEFRDFILSPGMIICGGNDNDDEDHRITTLPTSTKINIPLQRDDLNTKMYCRKDPKHGFWTVFNPNNGNKVRFSFEETSVQVPVVRASTPELVDLKITQKCFYNCEFCYQGSTPEGEHANKYDIYNIIQVLESNKVFEVALGGGEPTIHPHFIDILRTLKRSSIVVNFTTRSLSWIKDTDLRDQILPLIGSFAYSVTHQKQVVSLGSLTQLFYMHNIKPVIHVVMGTVSEYALREILKVCHMYQFSVTLLGFKTTGRGDSFFKQECDWLRVAKELLAVGDCPSLGIDTCLAQQYETQLIEENIPSYAYTLLEGAFSCYVDAVALTMGPSSFCSPEEMKPLSTKKKSEWGLDVQECALTFAEIYEGLL
jgi:hypothetical protein